MIFNIDDPIWSSKVFTDSGNAPTPATGFALVAHGVATNTGTVTLNTTGANLIVVCVVAGGLNATTIFTENKGNTIQTPAAAAFSPGGSHGAGQIYYIFSPTVGSGHIFTGGASANIYFVSAWSGALAGSGVFDVGNGAGNAGAGATSFPTGSVTPSATNELLVSMVLNDDNGTAWTVPTSFTSIDTSTSFGNEASAYLIDSAASAINPTWTIATGVDGGAAVAVFKHA